MSGICGVVGAGGLDAMTAAMAHRGTATTWTGDAVALATVGGDAVLQQGPYVVAGDLRIDNRAELIRRLDLPPNAQTDAHVVLAAYEKWDVQCPAELIGDFAFAVWHRAERRLFCARDVFGVRPLYFSDTAGAAFRFATTLRALLPFASGKLNDLAIADYLMLNAEDRRTTMYAGIERLAPAHYLLIDFAQRHSFYYDYWTPGDAPGVSHNDAQTTIDGFRERFRAAVRARLPAEGAVGSVFSGGLDSTAVTGVARALLPPDRTVHTYSVTFPSAPQSDERTYIDTLLAQPGYTPTMIYGDALATVPEDVGFFEQIEEPYLAGNLFFLWEVFRRASADGVTVLLDGIDGDSVVTYGRGLLSEYARAGDWAAYEAVFTAWRDRRNFEGTMPALHDYYGAPVLTEQFYGLHWLQFARSLRALHRIGGLPYRAMLRQHVLHPLIPPAVLNARRRRKLTFPLFTDSFQRAHRDHLVYVATRPTPRVRSTAHENAQAVMSGLIPRAFELLDRATAAHGMTLRHPFFDRRLVEYCIGLPGELKLHDGYGRYILRRALEGTVPDSLRWRGTKAELSQNFRRVFIERDLARMQAAASDRLWAYVDRSAFDDLLTQAQNRKDPSFLFRVWSILLLGMWLGARENG